jgi:hypothetical protein
LVHLRLPTAWEAVERPPSSLDMRYLVTARLRKGRETALLEAIESRALGRGSVAGGEYLRDMAAARRLESGEVKWLETCFCETPLEEERPYWEAYFELRDVRDAHARSRCRDLNGTEPWACSHCHCTDRLEAHLEVRGEPFLSALARHGPGPKD